MVAPPRSASNPRSSICAIPANRRSFAQAPFHERIWSERSIIQSPTIPERRPHTRPRPHRGCSNGTTARARL
jgi:hypothetical protein